MSLVGYAHILPMCGANAFLRLCVANLFCVLHAFVAQESAATFSASSAEPQSRMVFEGSRRHKDTKR